MSLDQLALVAAIVEGTVALITLITVVISIFYLFRQTHEMREQSAASVYATISSTYQAISEQAIALDMIFFEHPELKPYFFGNVPLPQDPLEAERVLSLAEIHMDFMDMALVQVSSTPEYVHIPFEVYEAYFKEMLQTSPAMRLFYRENKAWYSPPVCGIADVVLGEFPE